jgi:pimeloyl-ACP methyl ester carboxylesterase
MSEPHLTRRPARRPGRGGRRGLVLMLHGRDQTREPLDARSLSWLRMRLMLTQIAPALHRAGLDVWLLRYRSGSWPDSPTSDGPVADARWAVERAATELGVPVVLLGHSMGARTAISVASETSVRGVVGLAPWFPPGESVESLAGRSLVAAHGRADRLTSFAATAEFVRRAARVTSSSEFVDMGDLDHFMLRGLRRWNGVAEQRSVAMFD